MSSALAWDQNIPEIEVGSIPHPICGRWSGKIDLKFNNPIKKFDKQSGKGA